MTTWSRLGQATNRRTAQGHFNFTKGCVFSPDGLCLLTAADDRSLRLYDLPLHAWTAAGTGGCAAATDAPTDASDAECGGALETTLRMNAGATITDYCWYPAMNSRDPTTCVFAAVAQDHPVQLWDAFTGLVRCTYRPYNHLDEIAAPNSVAFSPTGDRLFCGFNRCVRIFRTDRPGRECDERATGTARSGQKGTISCIAFPGGDHDPQRASRDSCTFVCGSYGRSVALYDTRSPSTDALALYATDSGVTRVAMSGDGQRVYASPRTCDAVLCWDVRVGGGREPIATFQRACETNQRMGMVLDERSTPELWCTSTDGSVARFDAVPKQTEKGERPSSTTMQQEASERVSVHPQDACNGISLHPWQQGMVATASGKRRLIAWSDSDDEEDEGCAVPPEPGVTVWQRQDN